MASTYTGLGVELMVTGEKAGQWGDITNTNLQILEQISGGYTAQSIAGGAQTTTLSVSDGSTGAVLSHRMIEFTGTIIGNQIVTIPLDVQTFYILRNSTSGAYTVQFKYVSGSGDSFTFSATNKGDKVVFASANDGTNPDIISVNTGIADVVSDTTPQLGGDLDVNGNALVSTSNGNIALTPNGTGVVRIDGSNGIDMQSGAISIKNSGAQSYVRFYCESSNAHYAQLQAPAHSAFSGNITLTLPATTDTVAGIAATQTFTNKTLTSPKIGTSILDTNGNEVALITATSSAVNEVTFTNAATGNNPAITASGGDTNVGLALKTKGTGVIQAEDSGGNVSAVKIAGKESIWIPAVAMYPNSTNGCADLDQTELANGPEIKTLDFDKDSDEFAQFAVAFPKSWNEGTVTFQAFFTADSTNTGTVSWGLSGVAIADNDSCNTAFGTQVAPTAKAHSGTANDLDVTAESGAVTIAGSPSTDEQVFFQISRDVSEDSLTADAKLLGIKLFFTTDAANDL